MFAIVFERAAQAFGETESGAPAGERPKTVIVSQKIADIDALALRRKLADIVIPAAVCR